MRLPAEAVSAQAWPYRLYGEKILGNNGKSDFSNGSFHHTNTSEDSTTVKNAGEKVTLKREKYNFKKRILLVGITFQGVESVITNTLIHECKM